MNIFEQYGIKEVMDVTLYGITYDKYDNEVYIPVIYFDTLKVSSVEQSAEQTSARGGLGNAEQVVWDHSKAINVTLQDALYTPASQSLLWGGYHGFKNMRIKGYWQEYEYDKDAYGAPIYFKKQVSKEDKTKDGWTHIKCPCNDGDKWINYGVAEFKKIEIKPEIITRDDTEVSYGGEKKFEIYGYEAEKECMDNHFQKAEVVINNFGEFSHSVGDIDMETYQVSFNNSDTHRKIIDKRTMGEYDEKGRPINIFKVNDDINYRLLEYRWNKCDMSMMTTGTDTQLAFRKDVDFCYHSFYDNNNKRIYFINGDTYSPKLEFYTTITKVITDYEGNEIVKTWEAPVGCFYIIEQMNIPQPEEEYAIHNISSHSRQVQYLDTLNKLTAQDTFAIDVDMNIKSYQYSQLSEYSTTELNVFFDPTTMKPYENNSAYYTTQKGLTITGNLRIIRKGEVYYKWTRRKIINDYANGKQIEINAKTFPDAFRFVGETYIKDRYGKEQCLQIEIPLCKLSTNTSLNLNADGEPTTVDMKFKALRKPNGTLMKFTYYDYQNNQLIPFDPERDKDIVETIYGLHFVEVPDTEVYCLPNDCQSPYNGTEETYLSFGTEEGNKRSDIRVQFTAKEGNKLKEIDDVTRQTLIDNLQITFKRGEQ